MRLLFVNYEFPPIGGGAAYASLATARELVAMGHQVDFLTSSEHGRSAVEEIDGIHVYRVRCFRRGMHEAGIKGALSFLGFALPRFNAMARGNRYDLYHYYFSLPTGLLSCLPGPHQAAPYVVSLRGSDVPGYDSALDRQHRLLLPLTRRIWRRASQVVANSADLRRLALESAPDLSIEVILNGATATAVNPGVSHAGVRILAVSRLIARKGLDTLIVALAKSGREQLSLDIAGDGPDRAALEELAQVCGIDDRVRFHGFVDRAGLAALHAEADLFALASRAESCSMALLEAMAAGLPVIATRVGGSVELVENGTNGLLFKADDVVQLSTALRTLADDPAQRQRFATVNRTLIRERFSWRKVAQRYESVFRQAARAGARQ